jgi:hypothetical protein
MKRITVDIPEPIFQTICNGLDAMLKTNGIHVAYQVANAMQFLDTPGVVQTIEEEAKPEGDAPAPAAPNRHQRRATKKVKR